MERTSRFTILLHLPADHGAQAVHDAVIAALSSIPAALRQSLAWDQGSEMALHTQISQALGMPVFFCDKASPWQRPSNENTNGLLRQYFRRAPTCAGTASRSWSRWPPNSTPGRARPWAGPPPPSG